MRQVNVRDTRDQIARLLDVVETGEAVIVTRRGKPAARLVPIEEPMDPFPDRSGLRAMLRPMRTTAVDTVRALRDEEGG